MKKFTSVFLAMVLTATVRQVFRLYMQRTQVQKIHRKQKQMRIMRRTQTNY